MTRSLGRLRQLARTFQYLRQQSGWQKIRQALGVKGLAPVVVSGAAPQNQTVLVLAPHPDDEAFGCGGALAWQAASQAKITVLFLGAGDGGDPKAAGNHQLATRREKEAAASVAVVNGQAEFWRLADGTLAPTSALVDRLVALLERLQPSRIYTPWLADNHPDHIGTTALLAAALQQFSTSAEIWQYEIWSPLVPNRWLPIGAYLAQKEKMMACHASQLANRQYQAGILGLNTYRGLQADLDGPAEAYFALSAAEYSRLDDGRTLLH